MSNKIRKIEMSDFGIHLERRGKIALITIDRPKMRNTLNEAMWTDLERVTGKLKEKLPQVLIINGRGDKAFCAGMDVNPDNPQIAQFIRAIENKDKKSIETLIYRIRNAVDSLVSLPIPIIAAINGMAYGGGAELAVRCDFRVADPNALIRFSEVSLGLMPDWGGGVALTRLLGSARAADLILTSRSVNAHEAMEMGLVNRISEHGKVLEEAMALAENISANGPRAVRSALEVIRKSSDMPIEKALDLESETAVSLIASGECFHGIAAFLEKRKADFPDISD
jgi:enoyl-CoA hydratase/carnithine racemase